MQRNHWLIAAALLLLVGNLIWYVWGNWGLITIHSEDKSLAEIIRSIEKQAGVTVKTDLDTGVPLRMHVDKVKLTEALETLSTLSDSRWRLAYLVGPDKGAIAGALGSFTSGQRVEGWKAVSVSAPGMVDDLNLLPDPRTDLWEVKPAKEPKLQAYLQQAARTVSANFIYPTDWNPEVSTPPKSGPISKILPRLAKAVQGRFEEVFLLQRSGRGGPGEDAGDDGDGPRFASMEGGGGGRTRTGFDRDRGGFDREAMEERIQAEIKKLPPADRAVAQQEHEERKKFFEEMRDLPPEQRAAKAQEFMNNDANAERMEKAASARDARRSPQQKIARARKYLDRKAQIKNGTAPTGGGTRP